MLMLRKRMRHRRWLGLTEEYRGFHLYILPPPVLTQETAAIVVHTKVVPTLLWANQNHRATLSTSLSD
jgi:hypothetical protein